MLQKKKKEDIILLEIPCASDYVSIVRLTISGIASRMNFTVEDIEDIKIAISEACTNAVQYAYNGQSEDKKISIKCISSHSKLEISVIDKGQGFNPKTIKNKREIRDSKSDKSGLGLGLTFMESLMDEIKLKSKIGTGTTVTLTKYLRK